MIINHARSFGAAALVAALTGCSSGDTTRPVPESAPASPGASAAASTERNDSQVKVSVPYRVSLPTFCAVDVVRFAGRNWVATSPVDSDVSKWSLYTRGTMVLLDENTLRFTVGPGERRAGQTITYQPGVGAPRACD